MKSLFSFPLVAVLTFSFYRNSNDKNPGDATFHFIRKNILADNQPLIEQKKVPGLKDLVLSIRPLSDTSRIRIAGSDDDIPWQDYKYLVIETRHENNFSAIKFAGQLEDYKSDPYLIGEFHFSSTDMGLPVTGIVGAKDLEARREAFRYYMEEGFARPEIIGMHYFQWIDQPVFGRFEGENYNFGFLDVCGRTYRASFDAAAATNERLYKVASGQLPPFSKVIDEVPPIFY